MTLSQEPYMILHVEKVQASSMDASWGVSLGCCSGHVPLGGHLEKTEPDEGIQSPRWPWNALGTPTMKWTMVPGKSKSGALCWNGFTLKPTPDKRLKMDG